MTKMTRRGFLGGGAAAAMGLVGSPVSAQGPTYADVVIPFMNFLKQTYRTPAGIDIIESGDEGEASQRAISRIARGIREGEYDSLPYSEQYEMLGCHLKDLSQMAQQIADQLHPYGDNPSIRWPFIEKIRQDADGEYHKLRILGYRQDCGRARISSYRYLEPRRSP